MTVEPRLLRDAMGCFATGITVITAKNKAGEAVGMTVNSFNSVSLDPPLILFSIARDASSFENLRHAESYAVNILSTDQQEISSCFASSGVNGFDTVTACLSDRDIPTIANSLATFECKAHAQHDGGDHVIFVGEVMHVDYAKTGAPLLYFRGGYAAVAAD